MRTYRLLNDSNSEFVVQLRRHHIAHAMVDLMSARTLKTNIPQDTVSPAERLYVGEFTFPRAVICKELGITPKQFRTNLAWLLKNQVAKKADRKIPVSTGKHSHAAADVYKWVDNDYITIDLNVYASHQGVKSLITSIADTLRVDPEGQFAQS